jgi:hypothetical protein
VLAFTPKVNKGIFLTGKQENLGSAGPGIFLTGKQENLEQENVKVWARLGLGSFLTGEQENVEQENLKLRGKWAR